MKNHNYNRQSGFTLIELLVGMTVGLLVIGSVGALFVPSLATFRNTQAISHIQESERYAINTLARSIAQAGFIGCDSSQPGNLVNVTDFPATGANWATQLASPLQILSAEADADAFIGGASGADEDAGANKRLIDGGQTIGDVITTITAGGARSLVVSHDSANETITFRGDLVNALDDQFVLLNDCNTSSLFQVAAGVYDTGSQTTTFSYSEADTINCAATSVNPNRVLLGGASTANCDSTAGSDQYAEYVFSPGTNGANLISTSYYLAESEVDPASLSSLYSISAGSDGAFGAPVELIAGVANMRSRYGVQGSAGGITYVSANTFDGTGGTDVDGDATLENFRNVVSVEVSLMLESTVGKRERGTSEKQSISFLNINGATVDCATASNSPINNSACPQYLNSDGPRAGRVRRVVKQVYNLRNITL